MSRVKDIKIARDQRIVFRVRMRDINIASKAEIEEGNSSDLKKTKLPLLIKIHITIFIPAFQGG
jgi:hypothetical protein